MRQERTSTLLPDTYVWLRPVEVGQAVGRSRAYIFERISRGEIPAKRICGGLRIRLDHAMRWIDEQSAIDQAVEQ